MTQTDQPAGTHFGARLERAVAQRGPLCAGIDPHPGLLIDWGLTDDAAGLERFALTATEALAGVCSIVKPQSAFFERHGSAGIAVLEKVIATATEAGSLVLLDVKRGDIGSTTQAYADAYLDPGSALAVDAITANPFLGFGSLDPFIETAARHGKGVFVLALTSNPQAPEVQQARVGERVVADVVLDHLRELNTGPGWGSFGAVVGATIDDCDSDLDINAPLLVPGVGAQGGTAGSVRKTFAGVLDKVIPSSSREILAAGPSASALIEAAQRSHDAFAAVARR